MSETVIPGEAELEIPQGGQVDETWEFWDDAAQTIPMTLTGCEATLRIGKDNASPATLTVRSHNDSHVALSSGSRLVLHQSLGGDDPSTIEFIITDEDTAALEESDFVRGGSKRDGFTYTGRHSLFVTVVATGVTTVENNGNALFYPTVEVGA